MKSLFLFPPATAGPLIFPSLFSLRNKCDSRTSDFSLAGSSWQCRGSKLSRVRSYFVYDFTSFLPFYPQVFNPNLLDSCVMIFETTDGCSSTDKLNIRCASECSVPSLFSQAITFSYVFPGMDGTYSSLNCTFDLVDMRTPVLWFSSSEVDLILDVWSRIGSSWNSLTIFPSCWSEISSNGDSVVSSWLKYTSRWSSSSERCDANSSSKTSCSSGSSYSSIKICGFTFWSPSTPVISDSPIFRPFLSVKIKCPGWSFPITLTRLITVCGMVISS